MADWLWGVKGGIGRVRFLAGFSLLMFLIAAVSIVAGAITVWAPPSFRWAASVLLVVVRILPLPSIIALTIRRIRDIGLNPYVVIIALLALVVADWLLLPVMPSPLWPDAQIHWLSSGVGIVAALVLSLWPGRTDDEDGLLVSAGKTPRFEPAAALLIGAVAVLGLGLAFDPFQAANCPLIGQGRPGDDCASHGAVGRVYSAALVIRANSLEDHKNNAAALRDADRAIAIRPGFVYAYNARGGAYQQMDDMPHALEAYNHAVGLAPGYIHGLLNRSIVLDAMGQKSAALADLHKVLTLDPHDKMALEGVAYLTGA